MKDGSIWESTVFVEDERSNPGGGINSLVWQMMKPVHFSQADWNVGRSLMTGVVRACERAACAVTPTNDSA